MYLVQQVLEGKPIYADCFGNLVPLTKSGQHHIFSFFAFKENRLALFIKVIALTYTTIMLMKLGCCVKNK